MSEAGEQEIIRVTPEHPFWVAGKGWVASGELVSGDELFSAIGRSVRVLALEPDGEEPVFNFEVAETHDYFVGSESVLVHNSCGANDALSSEGPISPDETRRFVKENKCPIRVRLTSAA